MPPVTNFFEAVVVSVAAALMAVLSFIPALIGALIIVLIGWLLSDFIARLVVKILDRAGFEHAAQRTGISDFLGRTGMENPRASVMIGELVKWFIRLIFLEAAAQAVHLTAVTSVINSLILFIPNLIVALVVLMVGMMVARFAAGIVRGSAAEAGFQNPNLLATVAQVLIMGLAVLIAVNQIGIAATLVNTFFMALMGAFALALGLAFGLGGREVAGNVWKTWYARGQAAGPKLEQAAATAQARAAETAPAAGVAPAPAAQPQPARPAPAPAPPQQAPRTRPTVE